MKAALALVEVAPLDRLAAIANAAHRDFWRNAVVAGQALLEAKQIVKQARGNWLEWIRANCDFSERTAQAYMQVARDPQRAADFDPAGPAAIGGHVMNLTPADVKAHAALGVTLGMLERAQVCRVDDLDARERLTTKHPGDLSGILYPYLQPTTGSASTYRLRRDHPEIENGKPKDKYLAAWGDRKRLYFPPRCATLLADIAVDVILVEAEKSVLSVTCAAERVGRVVLAVGTGGCWGWRGVIGKTEDANGARVDEKGPLPDLDLITWTGRTVVITFDANAATNAKVQAARRALTKELAGRGATVRILDLPTEAGINGPDDYIGQCGDETFFALVDKAGTASVGGDVLEEFQHYFITQLGSKDGGRLITMVGCDGTFPPSFQTFGAFSQYYGDTPVNIGTPRRPKWTTRAKLWLQSTQHRKYTDVQFLPPPLDVPVGVLNLWNGFAVEADPEPHPEQRCALFLAHVRQVVCAGEDADVAEFLLDVLARKIQAPARLTEVSIAARGGQGVGKNTLTDYYGGLFGTPRRHRGQARTRDGTVQRCVVVEARADVGRSDVAGS